MTALSPELLEQFLTHGLSEATPVMIIVLLLAGALMILVGRYLRSRNHR